MLRGVDDLLHKLSEPRHLCLPPQAPTTSRQQSHKDRRHRQITFRAWRVPAHRIALEHQLLVEFKCGEVVVMLQQKVRHTAAFCETKKCELIKE